MAKPFKKTTQANIGFEKQIWDAACVLWGHIPAAEYRKVIIGLIFLRYISCAFDRRYKTLVEEGDGFENDRDAYMEENVFFVPSEARWEHIAANAHKPEIGMVIDNAMQLIETENKTLKNVLPKNYANPDLDKKVLGDVVDIFTNNIDMSDVEESKDLLGRAYEYCIAQFAAVEGQKGGEFYTPSCIVRTLVEILKPYENCRVYDPACGSGGMFVQSAKFIEAHSHKRGAISVYGQEANADTWKMAKMNMAIRGIDANFGPYQADTFANDLHPTLKADFILANPPFNYHPWGQEALKDDVRWKYGLPPASNANYAWIEHMIHHLRPERQNRPRARQRRAQHQHRRRRRHPQEHHRGGPCRRHRGHAHPALLQRDHPRDPLVPRKKQKAARQDALCRCPQHGSHGRSQAPRP